MRFRWSKAVGFGLAFALVLGLMPPKDGAQAATAVSGSFSVLSYNVGGLPWGLSSTDPAVNTPQISPKLNLYDIVNVQEDFNYHAALYAGAHHPYKTPTSGGAGIGSGLNTLSDYPMSDLARVTWNDRYGLFDNGSDQLTPKGFTATRHRLAEGLYVDVYNLHADAGTDPGSMAARASNLRQLAGYIQTYSQGNAVIVFGDTNTRYTREKALLEEVLGETGLTDVWIELVRGGSVPDMGDALMDDTNRNGPNFEVVDKIFYRSSPLLELEPVQYRLEDEVFVDAAGNQLSDHYPVTAVFEYAAAGDIAMSDPFGGGGGTPFNQLALLPASRIASVTLQSGTRVDGLSLGFANGSSLGIGGTANASSIALDADEYIKQVTLHKAERNGSDRIFYARIATNKGKQLVGGTMRTDAVTYTAPDGWYIAGFYGRAGAELDRLGVIYKRL